jgi:ABC-type nitrate/sulfonate/bicarbonate transport system permease component
MVPLAVAIFGIGETGKYFIVSYATTIVMAISTSAGVVATPRIRIRAAQCLGASKSSIFFHIVVPSAWPYILTGLRIALGYAFTAIVAAEMIATHQGIGYLIMQSTNMLEARDMWIGFFLLGGIGMVADQSLRAVIGRLARRHMVAMGR